jgi:hypothetical protein
LVGLKKNPVFDLRSRAGVGTVSTRDAPALKSSVSVYLEKIRQRDIFSLGERTASFVAESRGPSSRIISATENLKLVGISWSNDPDAMIEDKKALRTFFVKRGQMIGYVKVQAIFKDKVILSYGGEEIELK